MTAVIQSVGAFNYEYRFSQLLPMRNNRGELRSTGWVLSLKHSEGGEGHQYFATLKSALAAAELARITNKLT